MRLLLAVAALLAAGCTNVARTVTAPPPAWHDDRGGEHQPAYVLAPVYADDRALVFLACERAALGYLGHVDQQDAQAGTLAVHESNAWFGDCDLAVQLVAADGGTRVDATVTHGAEVARSREATVLEKYIARVDVEMRTIRGLRAAIAQPTSAGAGVAAADGAAAPSGTSRP